MMEPALAAQFPNIKTYHGFGVDDPNHRIRLDWTTSGLNAMLQLPDGLAFVKPYSIGDTEHYLTYYERDLPVETAPFECGTIEEKHLGPSQGHNSFRAGDCQMRTYRLAVSTTGEYSSTVLGASAAGTAADEAIVMNHVTTSINQINGFYERDITARFILITNITDIFYFEGSTDPFTNGNSSALLGENITNTNAVIGLANYDIGHILGSSGGTSGVAGLGVLCGSSKARGVTVSSSGGITTPRFLKVWSHEMGHQFGAGHTQNENCQRSSASAMEPGAGTTLMSYVTSACANQIQTVPDYYFHAISIQQMSATSVGTTCATIQPSANLAPTVSAGLDKSVPSSTPLVLNAVASDPDGDPLTYSWEQFDNDAATSIPPQPTNTLGPQFRSLPMNVASERYLPNLPAVLSGTTPTWEVIPSVARQMEFRVTVRDNSTNSISCTDEDNMVITTVAGGPFSVNTASSTGTVWFEGQSLPISWNVAGTNTAPVSCGNVDILLSYDGGLSYPTTLATAVPNTGSANITVPLGTTTTARIMVKCSDNIFYNISETNIEIQLPASPTFTLTLPNSNSSDCQGVAVSIPIQTSSIAGFTGNINLSVTNVPGGAGANFSSSTISAGQSTTLNITNTASLAPGDYPLTITGTSGTIVRSQNYTLTVLEPAGLTILDVPIASAVDVELTPSLEWLAKPNATSYTIQLSQDINFVSTIVNQNVSANSFTVTTSLNGQSTYYWRVQSTTTCGVTPWSTTREFTTANCLAPLTQNIPVSISSSGTPTVTSVITVSQPGTVDEVSVSAIGSHTWVSDLDVELIGPGGSPIVRLWEDLCGSDDNFDLSLSDNAATAVSTAPCNPLGQGGTFRPIEPLSAFFGSPIAGDWTLRIMDDTNADGGTLTSWTINFCAAASVPLPVEMLSFTAVAEKNKVLLDWKTASETDNSGFGIERRTAYESEFSTIGDVAATDNVQQVNEYTYVDQDVRPGVRYYYRLRQNDLDGNFDYSDIRTVSIKAETTELQVYPNPVQDVITGFLNVEPTVSTDLLLLDLNGRIIHAQTITGNHFAINVNTLPAGMYVLKALHREGDSIVKLVVE